MASFQSISGQSLSTEQLRGAAVRDPKGSIKEAAKQFETLFMQEVMKSMRASTLASGMLDNSATQLGTEMLDTQFAGKMSGLPGGLSSAIERQLQRQMGLKLEAKDLTPERIAQASQTTLAQALPQLATRGIPTHVQGFIQQHDSAAKAASAATGIPASFMVAQAAHESGWGQREIKGVDGAKSFNLFGIKATPGWTGKTVDVQTTEVINGQAQKLTAKFRAYGSYEESFKDYAKLIGNNQRYAKVVAQAQGGSAEGFARGLQQAGYATDPAYADKLAKVINTTQRVQRSLA